VAANRPGAPDWLSAEALAVWDALPDDVLTAQPVDALTVYCCAVADFTRAQQALDRTGVLIRGARGGLVRSPLNLVKADNAHTIAALARQLGLASPPGDDEGARQIAQAYRNRAATERTITGLRRGGRLEDADAAAVALARHIAHALDHLDPARWPAQTASLARVHLATLRALRGVDDNDQQQPGGIDELLAALSAPVGDPENP